MYLDWLGVRLVSCWVAVSALSRTIYRITVSNLLPLLPPHLHQRPGQHQH